MGYVRPDGKVGARNYVAVIPSVTCANDVAAAICHQVMGTVTYLHHQGCCQLPPDLERVTDTLISIGCSPNSAAVLIVSLGCEGTDHERMVKEISATGKPVEIIHIQELGGVSKAIQVGTDIARRLVIEASGIQRQPVDVSNIVMSIKCGGSDATSGMASNCVIGYVADKLVDLGATVIFGETTEFIGGAFVTRQIISVSIKSGFRTRADWDEYFAMNEAIKENRIGEWALQSATAEMESDTDSNVGGAESTDSGIDVVSKIQRTAGRKKIQERPLIDYLNCKNKTEVLQCLRSFVSINRSAVHQALPYYVLKELRLVDGMHTAKEYSVGLTLQFPDLPSLKSESAIRQAVGSLKTARHIIKDGKDQSAPLIESDENRELFRTLTEEISGIIRTDGETDIAE